MAPRLRLTFLFWFSLLLVVLVALYHHRWSPVIRHRLSALAAASDTLQLADVIRADWDRACLVRPYDDPIRVRAAASWEVPWGAGPAMNEVDNVVLFVKGRRLVAYDRIDMARLDFAQWPSPCIARDRATLVREVDSYQRQVWQLVGE